jgi:energy-coupling factor transporter ATP-binding protein EcfA2
LTRPVLRVDGLRLSVVGNLLFNDLSFDIPPAGIVGVMGPVGTGKSSLMKWICGTGDPDVYVGKCRDADYFYRPLDDGNRPRLLAQKAAKSFEESMIMINAMLRPNPAMICLDEVTAGLSDKESAVVIDRVLMISRSRAVMFVSHKQDEVEAMCDSVILLAGGMLQEHTPTEEFFRAPRSDAGRQFVRTGGVSLPRIGTPARHLRSDLRGVPDGMRLAGERKAEDGPFRTLIDTRLRVPDLAHPDSLSLLNSPKCLIDAGISAVVHVSETLPEGFGQLEAAGVYEDWLPVASHPDTPIAEYRRRCTRISERMRASGVLICDPKNPANAHLAATMQMIEFGLSAARAAELLGDLNANLNQPPIHEQLLWDLELAIDLEGDTGSAIFEADAPSLHFGHSGAVRNVSA